LFDVPARVFQVQIFPSAIDPTSYCTPPICRHRCPPKFSRSHVVRRMYTTIKYNNNTRYYVSIGPNRLVTLRVLSLDALTAVPFPPSTNMMDRSVSVILYYIFIYIIIKYYYNVVAAANRKPPLYSRGLFRRVLGDFYQKLIMLAVHGDTKDKTTVMSVLLQVTTSHTHTHTHVDAFIVRACVCFLNIIIC